ncbi:protein MET1, chloroplastic-like isoform X2 [Juglans microcarpa x Juglans regia]|uniref:protein MET1, chloroplastic-like isoform X2 n=1 Tax=Juglans microcarpa x Juglans regia TaxID=2249226 RepID=UPI001B7E93B9|nr:protein MET1, chloroplastic-like isoform X2 [Juglans microcarpa x Juglans regia]
MTYFAPSSHPSLCSSPPLPRTKRTPALVCQSIHFSFKNQPFLSTSNCFPTSHLLKPSILIVKASETESPTSKAGSGSDGRDGDEEQYEEYEVELVQPYGLKFTKGRDGGTYIDAIASGGSADQSEMFAVGDKVLATSAVFGTEIWPAAEYGRTMYTIRQRVGPLLMRMQKRYGKLEDVGELTEKEIIRAERNSGVISNRVREIQKKGTERAQGKGPSRRTATLQLLAGLSALEDALQAGFEDFKRIRTDPDLAKIRTSQEFETLLKRFDESFINENAINAIKSLFGILNKN